MAKAGTKRITQTSSQGKAIPSHTHLLLRRLLGNKGPACLSLMLVDVCEHQKVVAGWFYTLPTAFPLPHGDVYTSRASVVSPHMSTLAAGVLPYPWFHFLQSSLPMSTNSLEILSGKFQEELIHKSYIKHHPK